MFWPIFFSTRKWWNHSLQEVRVKKKINSILESCYSIGWQLAISNLKMSNLKLKGKMILISCRCRHGYKSIVAMATVAMATFFFLDVYPPHKRRPGVDDCIATALHFE